MKLTYYGHSCFAVEVNGKSLLFDPFITPNELAKKSVLQILMQTIFCNRTDMWITLPIV